VSGKQGKAVPVAFSVAGFIWLLLLGVPDDPIPAEPAFPLMVNGSPLSAHMAAFIAEAGSQVHVSCPDSVDWAFADARGSGREFSFMLSRTHGVFSLTARNGSSIQEWAVLVPVDGSRMRTTTLNSYPMGFFGGTGAVTRRHIPDRFIELNGSTIGTRLSTHFVISDFLCTIRGDWPQYMALDLRLVQKLEALLAEVRNFYPEARDVHIISGFRTPAYNAAIGNETDTSLHLYGKAADFWIEGWPGNDLMDDVDRNKRIDVYDGEYLIGLVRALEARGDVAAGGASAYRWTESHGPYVHVDTRGSAARWQTRRSLVTDPVI